MYPTSHKAEAPVVKVRGCGHYVSTERYETLIIGFPSSTKLVRRSSDSEVPVFHISIDTNNTISQAAADL